MRLVREEGADRRRENLPTSDEVAAIIPDEYGDPSYRDIVLAGRSGAGPPTDRAATASTRPTPPTCFFRTETMAGTTSYGSAVTASGTGSPLRQYFRFYLHVRGGHELVPFAYCRLFQQYLIDAWWKKKTQEEGGESGERQDLHS